MFRFVSTICLLFAGCFNPFAPELENNPDLSNVITEQQSPDEVLQNFRVAYTFKDSVLYSEVLDESFVFEYFDANLDPKTMLRDEDLKTTGTIFRNFDVIDLVWHNTLFIEVDTMAEGDTTAEKRFIRFNLNLFGPEFNFIITGTAIFTFEKSESDNRWRITRWKDESDL